jgi:hypothetical protein
MSNSKTIQFNPMFCSSSSTKSVSPKREKKEKPQVSVKPNKMKKHLLAKIKDFQNKTEKEEIMQEKKKEEEEEFDQGFADEFNKSLNFLSELSKQRKQKPNNNRNETLKKGKVEQAVHLQISTELPEELKVHMPMPVKIPVTIKKPIQQHTIQQHTIQQNVPINNAPIQQNTIQQHNISLKPSPVYSNLKGGSRPTYRQYHNKTQKNYGHESVKPLIRIDNGEQSNAEQSSAEQSSAEQSSAEQSSAEQSSAAHSNVNVKIEPNIKKTRFKKRITRTLKYSLGKHSNGKVSVLIKNAKTRRKVQTEQALLKQKTITDIKHYLRSKNLLKVGSDVPNDVLRQMYESAILAGDVTNKSKDTLIHNYLNEK